MGAKPCAKHGFGACTTARGDGRSRATGSDAAGGQFGRVEAKMVIPSPSVIPTEAERSEA